MNKIFTYKITGVDDIDDRQIHDSLQGVMNEIEAVLALPIPEDPSGEDLDDDDILFEFTIVAEKIMTQEEFDNIPVQ